MKEKTVNAGIATNDHLAFICVWICSYCYGLKNCARDKAGSRVYDPEKLKRREVYKLRIFIPGTNNFSI